MKHEKEERSRIRKMTHTLETKLLAMRMLDNGAKLEDAADVFDVSVQTVGNWRRRLEKDDIGGLRRVEGQAAGCPAKEVQQLPQDTAGAASWR